MCTEYKIIKHNLKVKQERNITLLAMMEYVEKESSVIATKGIHTVSKKEKQLLGL